MRKRGIDLKKEQHWRAVLHRFQESKLPFRRFCELERISPNSFQYWRKRLRQRDAERGIVSTITKGENRPSKMEEKREFWLHAIDEANNFVGSLRQFCIQRKISSGSLYNWEKRLREAGLTAGLRKSPSEMLVPVHVVPNEIPPPNGARVLAGSDEQKIEIRLHDGNRVLLPASLPTEVLIHLLNGLRGKIC